MQEMDTLIAKARFEAKLEAMAEHDMLLNKDGTPDEDLGAFSGYLPYARVAE